MSGRGGLSKTAANKTALTLNNVDTSYAEHSLELLIGATAMFLNKAEQANNAALELQDDDNPEPLPMGKEVIRADKALEKTTKLQKWLIDNPAITDDTAVEFESKIENLVTTAEDIGIKVPRPGKDT